ncbi:MAG TPA: type II toxin-antitoxin system prevent-host-death family antitoxin [Patescibacteria group bacterium]|nr:type II toxin-antitoxin system prevent-host-death family antitoxin [Patescibacteria group bacterium]
MDRIAIRELKNYASRVVRRAKAGERIVITVDGVPAAEIGPVTEGIGKRTLEALIATRQVIPPRSSAPPQPARPARAPAGKTTTEILQEQRDR